MSQRSQQSTALPSKGDDDDDDDILSQGVVETAARYTVLWHRMVAFHFIFSFWMRRPLPRQWHNSLLYFLDLPNVLNFVRRRLSSFMLGGTPTIQLVLYSQLGGTVHDDDDDDADKHSPRLAVAPIRPKGFI